ncbi:hypothetical protein [Nonomuraea sp. NPDC003804]|uniref:hypothetical protein n=1 Tax=Nonomuraea sp. NPDC003804 TaxID=3154547 RepID=UPI0033BD36E5
MEGRGSVQAGSGSQALREAGPEEVTEVSGASGALPQGAAGPERSLEDVRARLGEAQASVVAALVAGGAPPAGFDQVRLAVQARSLLAKRRGIVARLRPDAAAAAGAALVAEFAAYAAARTEPPARYRADADDFADWLRARGILHDPPPRRRGRLPFPWRRR